MACWDDWHLKVDQEPNGDCPDCGVPTLDGFACEGCHRAQVVCYTCGYAPCEVDC